MGVLENDLTKGLGFFDTANDVAEMFGGGIPGMDPLGAILDGFTLGDGLFTMGKGLGEDGLDSPNTWRGLGDTLNGGVGIAGAVTGNPFVKAFSTGMSVGNMVAPNIFGSESGFTGLEEMEEDGDYGWEDALGDTFFGQDTLLGKAGQDFEHNPLGQTLDLLSNMTGVGLMAEGVELLFGDILPSFDDIVPDVFGTEYNLADVAAQAQAGQHVDGLGYNLADIAAAYGGE